MIDSLLVDIHNIADQTAILITAASALVVMILQILKRKK